MEKIIYDEIITAGHFRLLARKDVQTARAFVCLSEIQVRCLLRSRKSSTGLEGRSDARIVTASLPGGKPDGRGRSVIQIASGKHRILAEDGGWQVECRFATVAFRRDDRMHP